MTSGSLSPGALEAMGALFGLHGRTALVTGGNRGIGRGIALAMATAGAAVVVAARDAVTASQVVDEIRKTGGVAAYLPLDVQNEASVAALFAAAYARFGAVDIVVNNAGIFPATPLLETDGDTWDEIFRINTRGPFLCLREAARRMIESERGGRIINISSMGSRLPAAPGRVAYNASKAALDRLTQDAAAELARHDILVNAVLPGPTDTSGPEPKGERAAKLHTAVASRVPLGRWASPADVASATLFLAGPAASFITGQTLLVDGGYTLGSNR